MSDSMFEEARSIAKQLQQKFPNMPDEDARVLADMVIKFGEDINELMMRTLKTFSPLLNDLNASMLAPICLGDAAVQLGFTWKKQSVETVRDIREMAKAAMTGSGDAGFLGSLLEALAKARGK